MEIRKMIDYVKELPENVKLSIHLKEKAEGYFRITYVGYSYYLPLTKECKKLFGIQRRRDEIVFDKYKEGYMFEEFIRDIIASVYLQTRDTVGMEIREDVMRVVKDKISDILVPQIDKEVDNGFETKDKLLGEKNEE